MAYTTINKPNQYFNTKLYTGNGSSQSITGVGFQPDFCWLKQRNNASAYTHQLYDVVRGVTNYILTSSTAGEVAEAQGLTAFNADGFSIGSNVGLNDNGVNHVSWNWKANGAGVTNTQGTLTATVSANTTSGFSICKITEASSYSGVQTFGHGLGVAPSMVIYRMSNTGSNWQVYHKSTGTGLMQLNNTNAVNTGASYFPAVSSTTVSIGEGIQGPTYTSIAYCFAEVKGFSKFGSYTGNGSTNGTFIYTGFKPAFVMIKSSSDAGSYWVMLDVKRNTFNVINLNLYANVADSETTDTRVDTLSNGFKLRGTGSWINTSNATYIYMAFAENPLVGTNNVPATAR